MRTLPGAVLLAAVGFAVAHYAGTNGTPAPPPAIHQIAGRGFTVSYASPWQPDHPAAAAAGSVALTDAGAADGRLVIEIAHPRRPGALAAPVAAALRIIPPPQLVRLGGAGFLRYPGGVSRPEGRSETLYTVPTTRGTATGICSATRADAAVTGACEQILATLRMSRGRILALTPDTAYGFQLNQIIARLDAVRADAGAGLRSTDPKVIAAAASKLASADARAGAEMRHISGSGVSAANPQLAAALDAQARAYGGLTGAAGALDPAGYARAQASLTRSDARVAAAYAELRRLGYAIGAGP